VTSNKLFFKALRELIDHWCDERRLQPLAHVLPGYLAFNGLTDGWADLYAGLVDARSVGPDCMTPADWTLLCDLIGAARLLPDNH
jgi:hypothetical protein